MRMLRLLGRSTTRRIIVSLSGGPATVETIASACGRSTSAVRQGIADLGREGLVTQSGSTRPPRRFRTCGPVNVRKALGFVEFELRRPRPSKARIAARFPETEV